jgi:hypothetical protein
MYYAWYLGIKLMPLLLNGSFGLKKSGNWEDVVGALVGIQALRKGEVLRRFTSFERRGIYENEDCN